MTPTIADTKLFEKPTRPRLVKYMNATILSSQIVVRGLYREKSYPFLVGQLTGIRVDTLDNLTYYTLSFFKNAKEYEAKVFKREFIRVSASQKNSHFQQLMITRAAILQNLDEENELASLVLSLCNLYTTFKQVKNDINHNELCHHFAAHCRHNLNYGAKQIEAVLHIIMFSQGKIDYELLSVVYPYYSN